MTAVDTKLITVEGYVRSHKPDWTDEQVKHNANLIREAIAGHPDGDQSQGTDEHGKPLYTEAFLATATQVAVMVAFRRATGADIPSPEGYVPEDQ